MCYALLLALTTLCPYDRISPFPLMGINLGLGVIVTELLLLIIDPRLSIPYLSIVGESLSAMGLGALFRMSHACHLGGALAGWLIIKIQRNKFS